MEIREILEKIQNKKVIAALIIICTAAFMRVVPHPPNIAPITGLALFSGSHLKKKSATILPIGAMLLSDLIIGLHQTMVYVYGSFLLITMIGVFIKKNNAFLVLASASLISSILFFIVTNFGVWASVGVYPKTAQGLINAYIMGIPFFRNTLIGDMAYTVSFFYGYRILVAAFSKYRIFLPARKRL